MAVIDLQERTISGKGILKVDPLTDLTYRLYLLYVNVIRRPLNESYSANYNPSQGFYACLTFLRNGYVVETKQVKYTTEIIRFEPDICGQVLLALKCCFDGINQSFINQNTALGLPITGVNNPIDDYTLVPLYWDTIKVKCWSTAALRLTLKAIEYDTCNEDYINALPTGEPVEPIPGVVPVNDPLSGTYALSSPYEYPDDGGDTVPVEGDALPEPLEDRCIRILNQGISSGAIVFENFICGANVEFPPATPIDGNATYSIVVTNAAGDVVQNTVQAGYTSGTHTWSFVDNDSVRQPEYSYGNCSACNV